jgi:hypothetical protein
VKIQATQVGINTNISAGHQAPWIRRAEPHPLSVLLFGKRPPKLLDRRKYPRFKKAMRKLDDVKDQIAEIMGQVPAQLEVQLAEGANASISREGRIAVGIDLLGRHEKDDDLWVAILGHEIGHAPWTWPRGSLGNLTKAQLDALYREEEAKADRFAGKVLAELGGNPEAICRFLIAAEQFEGNTPSDYYPAPVRAAMIRQAAANRSRILQDAGALFPELLLRGRDLR